VGLGAVVEAKRATAASSELNAEAAKNAGRVGQDMAAANNEAMLRAAQKTALTLGLTGTVSSDDVTREMASQGYNVMPRKDGKRHAWKGKIFPPRQWVKVGDIPSTLVSSHARPIGQWVTKEWLRTNSLNGRQSRASAFTLIRVFKDFEHFHKRSIDAGSTKLADCNWYIGDEQLDPGIRKDIQVDGNKLYGVPVSFVPGAIGALMLPPDPSKLIQPKQTKEG
jgi:hypothetical protein